jgi:hypothetical protein
MAGGLKGVTGSVNRCQNECQVLTYRKFAGLAFGAWLRATYTILPRLARNARPCDSFWSVLLDSRLAEAYQYIEFWVRPLIAFAPSEGPEDPGAQKQLVRLVAPGNEVDPVENQSHILPTQSIAMPSNKRRPAPSIFSPIFFNPHTILSTHDHSSSHENSQNTPLLPSLHFRSGS